jgi:hypothetical protein
MVPTRRTRKPLASRRKYTGQLSEAIYEPIGGLLAELFRSEAEKRAREQQFLKLKALFAWYEIDPTGPNAWRSLAIALALVHVPGMTVVHDYRRRRGRKQLWKAGLGIELVRAVEALQAKKPLTTQDAIRALIKTKDWRRHTEQSLLARHRDARRLERKRRAMAEELLGSPTSQMMGGLFGNSLLNTDRNP